MVSIPQAFLKFEREYDSGARRVGKIIVLYSPQGGVGRTTIATNLAIALQQSTQKAVALVDGNLAFGDIAVILNISPKAKTIADLVGSFDSMDAGVLESVLVAHSTGIKVLLAPPTPESAEIITGPNVQRTLELLDERYAYIVVDTWPSFQEQVIRMLDMADLIVVPVTLEVACLRNVRIFLQIADLLGYSPEKVQLVANRVDEHSIKTSEAEAALGKKFMQVIAWDRPLFARAAHRAMPFVWSEASTRGAKELRQLAEKLQLVWQASDEVSSITPSGVSPGSTAEKLPAETELAPDQVTVEDLHRALALSDPLTKSSPGDHQGVGVPRSRAPHIAYGLVYCAVAALLAGYVLVPFVGIAWTAIFESRVDLLVPLVWSVGTLLLINLYETDYLLPARAKASLSRVDPWHLYGRLLLLSVLGWLLLTIAVFIPDLQGGPLLIEAGRVVLYVIVAFVAVASLEWLIKRVSPQLAFFVDTRKMRLIEWWNMRRLSQARSVTSTGDRKGGEKMVHRVLVGLAALLAAYVIAAEVPFWASRSSLAPVLTALAAGLLALAAAEYVRGRSD